jgi:hypothetical protein
MKAGLKVYPLFVAFVSFQVTSAFLQSSVPSRNLVQPKKFIQSSLSSAFNEKAITNTPAICTLGVAIRGNALKKLMMAEQQSESTLNVRNEVPIEIRGFSLATVGLLLGSVITIFSFAEYLLSEGSEGLSGVGFVYGIPILLIGLSLKYAQLDPVPVATSPDADRIFEEKATDTILKIEKDVTRHRYGDDAHLDTTIAALGLVVRDKEFPQLEYLKKEVINGELAFSMVFKSEDTPYTQWSEPERVLYYDKFFGPGVWAVVEKIDAARRLVAIKLITGERKEMPLGYVADNDGSMKEEKEEAEV